MDAMGFGMGCCCLQVSFRFVTTSVLIQWYWTINLHFLSVADDIPSMQHQRSSSLVRSTGSLDTHYGEL
jgi:hypothetical protein